MQQQTRRPRPQPPAIPEIARAYQNDPRTQIALQQMGTGSSTAPVAGGKYAWADGIARAIQGVAGGYIAKQQAKEYGKQEQELLELRRQRGVDGMNGTTPVGLPPQPVQAPPAPMAPQAPAPIPTPVAAQAAAALGAPAPAPAPQMAAPAPFIGQQAPLDQMASINGGLPRRQAPFPSAPAPTQGDGGRVAMAFVDPLAGKGTPTSGFGPRKAPVAGASTFHGGQDFAAPRGTPVLAAGGGRVLRAWNDTKYGGGLSVIIKHDDGSKTGYAHLDAYQVRDGDVVQPGQPIGAVGATGRATGPHLHLTYRDPTGKKLNPLEALKFGQPAQAAPTQVAGPQEMPAQMANMQPPQLELPPEPEAVQRPNAPEARGPTRSRLLDGSYRIMSDANRYESAMGQDMYNRGLSEQTQLDEAATERDQRIRDAAYQNNFSLFANDQQTRTANAFENRRSIRDRNYQVNDREDNQQYGTNERIAGEGFQSRENALQRGWQGNEAEKSRRFEASQTQLQIQAQERARLASQAFTAQQADLERKARGDLKAEEAKNRRNGFFATSAGAKLFDATAGLVANNTAAIQKLDAFSEQMTKTNTGGFTLNAMPGLVTWANADLQVLAGLSADLTKAASQDMKGALSDKDVQFLKDIVPNIKKTGRANRTDIERIRALYERANQFQVAKLAAISDGTGIDFLRQWDAYSKQVPFNGPSYDQWLSSVPSFDANGNRVK